MNHIRTSAVGIDAAIQSVQIALYDNLNWTSKVDGYGRVYKNVKNDVVIPEVYIGKNEYKDAYYNDSMDCTFFFVDDDSHVSEDEFVFKSKVKCIFMVNLKNIYGNTDERLDSNAQIDVVSILRDFNYVDILGIEKGFKNVFSGMDTDSIKFVDIHPNHCFAINFDLSYYLTEKCE